MSKKTKALLISIVAVIVVVVLIFAYFATQPEVKWWKPEKEMKKPDVDFDELNSVGVLSVKREIRVSIYMQAIRRRTKISG